MRAEDINSLESESGVIATLLRKPEYYYHAEYLLPSHFTSAENRCVYAALSELVKKDVKNVDAFLLLQTLESSEATRRLSQSITLEKLRDLFDMADVLARHTPEEYVVLAKNVMNAAFRRDLYEKLRECQSMCLSDASADVSRRVYAALDETISEYSATDEIGLFGDVTDRLWSEIEERQGGCCGIPFHIESLNEYVTLEKGELVVVAAPQKGGKSMFCLNVAVSALNQGESVMYVDSELSDRLFLCRLISYVTGIEFSRVKGGRYDNAEHARILNALAWIRSQPFVHLYMPVFDQKSIYVAVKKVYHKLGGLGLLVVDYLKSTGNTDAFATYQELGKLTDLIKNDICGAMKIPGLAAAQLTANGALADSRKIARNASTILTLTDKTPDEIRADGPRCGNKKLYVQFNRNGAQMAEGEYIDLFFDGNRVSFREAERHEPENPY